MPSSRGSSQPKDLTQVSYVSCMSRWSFIISTTWEAQKGGTWMFIILGSCPLCVQDVPQYGEGNDNPLQYSCLEDPMDRGAWQSTSPEGHKESDTTKAT